MLENRDETARTAAMDFARLMAAFCDVHFGSRLLGVYLIGSLAHGVFSRRYSDIDFAVVTQSGLDPRDIAAIHAEAAARSPALAPKLSLFWTDRQFVLGRFPPLDRVDYHDFAITLLERERVMPARPTLEQIRAYLGGTPFSNWAATAGRFAAMDALDPKEHKLYIRAHLYPARLIFSWKTGRMASNDDAVAFTCAQQAEGLDCSLIMRALAMRRAALDPDDLFAARAALPAQVIACGRFLGLSD